MARADIISKLYSSQQNENAFNFNALVAPPLFSMISYTEIMDLEQILADPRWVTKLKDRLVLMEQILNRRKFMRITQGTNRAVYKFLDDQSIVLKAAISRPGIHDSYYEFYNQEKIKPFVAKCFETVPSGIVGLFERANDITSAEQFKSIAPDVFRLLNDHILGKYVMADIGSRFFRNYGIRLGFGPIILDYPMLYELDGNKLYCNNKDPFTGEVCDGPIDYDDGFNYLFCRKCGKQYTAKELAKNIENKEVIITGIGIRRKSKMVIRAKQGNKTLKEINCNGSASDTYLNMVQMQKLLLQQQYMMNQTTQSQPQKKELQADMPNNMQQPILMPGYQQAVPPQTTQQQAKTVSASYKQPAQQTTQQKVISAAMPKRVKPISILTLYLDSATIKEAELNSVDGSPIIPYPDDAIREAEEARALQAQLDEDSKQIEVIRQQIAAQMLNESEQENLDNDDAHYIYEKDIERIKKYLSYKKDQIILLLTELVNDVDKTSESNSMFYFKWIQNDLDKFGKGIGGLIDDNFDKKEKRSSTEQSSQSEEPAAEPQPESIPEQQPITQQEPEPERVEGEVIDPDPIIDIGNTVGETYSEPNKTNKQITMNLDDDKFANY